MLDDSLVQQLIEEMLDSERTPEEVCHGTPEMLAEVRERWRRLRAIQAQVGLLFPEPGSAGDHDPTESEIGPPNVLGYEVGEVLGRGGVGVVYKAMHLRLHRPVALKMLLAGAFATRAERQRFAREAEVVAELRHPNIVQVYDVGDLDGLPYFTMEFVEGGSLADLIAGTPRPARQAAELVATLADAIEAAHLGGILHRDLKPSNVLLSGEGTPKIGDFGLAHRLEVGSSLTQSGAAVGTPSYMSPEQARGESSEIGPASDLYALGAVLYELLTGRPPFRAESAAETMHQVITRDPVPPSRLNAKVPRDLETICLKCLHKDPKSRYDAAATLADDLGRFLRGEAIAARPEGPLARLARRVRRRPAFSAAVAIAALSSVALVGGGAWMSSDRAASERAANADRAATDRAADADMIEMEGALRRSAWPEARTALERARGRSAGREAPGPRRRIEQGTRDLKLHARIEEILTARSATIVAEVDLLKPDQEYGTAFHEAGVGRVDEPAEVVAARVRQSHIRTELMAALDDWAVCATTTARRDWLLAVARGAEENPGGWRERARDPKVWEDGRAFADIVRDAPVADPCVPLLLALDRRLILSGQNSLDFLTRVQRAHPDNFWVNLRAGVLTAHLGNAAEAVRYFQAAMALRSGDASVHNYLGAVLVKTGRYGEAAEHLKRAMELEPGSPPFEFNLAQVLIGLGRHDEAEEVVRTALRASPRAAILHSGLAELLEAKGRLDEAVAEHREAVAAEPNVSMTLERMRRALTRFGRLEEARATWARAIATNPPDHGAWYGYAEFCLFLDDEDEYRRARTALLGRFGDATDPLVAERTARACLLRPALEADLPRIVALAGHAWGVDRSKYSGVYPHFLFVQGLAEYRLDRLDRAISLMQGDASQVLGPAPRLVLAMALHRSGKVAAARKMLAAAILSHDWKAAKVEDQDGWIFHALRREAEVMILPDLPAFLEGKHQPRDNDERLALLGVCQFTNRHALTASLYAQSFATDLRLADDLRTGHRYNAARAAVLTGCGSDLDSAGLGEPERRRWREQARQWLRADIAAWDKVLDGNPATAPDVIQATLTVWRSAPDLTGLRDPAELDKLSADERKDCVSLWGEVVALCERAARAR